VPVTAKDFLNSALELVKENEEISKRNAISRAYYAAYHKSLEASPYLPNAVPDGVGLHQRLILQFSSFNGSRDSTRLAKHISYKLSRIRATRTKADYKLNESLARSDTPSTLDTARQLVDNYIDEFLGHIEGDNAAE
jgi:uncharacterized protein (UPF0332 family)